MQELELHHPHDALAKYCLSNLSVARDFLEAHLPGAVQECCNFNTLAIEPGSHIDEILKQRCSDILYSLEINDSPGYVYCLIEHQSKAEKLMPFRMLSYQVAIMQRHLDQGYDQLPLVIPLLLYHGRCSPYPYSVKLSDCFVQSELAEETLFKKLYLIDLTVMNEDEIMGHRRAALLEMVQKHIFTANIMEHIDSIKQALKLIKNYPELQTSVSSVIYYLYKEANVSNVTHLIENLTQSPTDYQEDAMTAAEYLIQKGLQQGMQQSKKEKETIARKLLATGMDRGLIKEITGVDLHPQ